MKNIQVRVDDDLKTQADTIFDQIGTTTNDAIKMFLKASIRQNGFPFELKLPEPTTTKSYIESKMLTISDFDFREALNGLVMVSGNFEKDIEDEGVFHESISINGFVGEDKEVTLAEAHIFIVDTSINDFSEVADDNSGDLSWVAEPMIQNLPNDFNNDWVAIIDNFYVFAPTATAVDRIELLRNVFEYLRSRHISAVGFCNAGIWFTENVDQQVALSSAIKDAGFPQIYKSKDWNGNSFGLSFN